VHDHDINNLLGKITRAELEAYIASSGMHRQGDILKEEK
jgi:hypothetical protein